MPGALARTSSAGIAAPSGILDTTFGSAHPVETKAGPSSRIRKPVQAAANVVTMTVLPGIFILKIGLVGKLLGTLWPAKERPLKKPDVLEAFLHRTEGPMQIERAAATGVRHLGA